MPDILWDYQPEISADPLFFKVWGMTNDIKEIRNKYLKDEDEKRRQKAEYDPSPKISGGVKTTI